MGSVKTRPISSLSLSLYCLFLSGLVSSLLCTLTLSSLLRTDNSLCLVLHSTLQSLLYYYHLLSLGFYTSTLPSLRILDYYP